METIHKLQTQFTQASNRYKTLKKETQDNVVQWFWASSWLLSLEPFYFEQHKFSKGRILKEEPENKKNKLLHKSFNFINEYDLSLAFYLNSIKSGLCSVKNSSFGAGRCPSVTVPKRKRIILGRSVRYE